MREIWDAVGRMYHFSVQESSFLISWAAHRVTFFEVQVSWIFRFTNTADFKETISCCKKTITSSVKSAWSCGTSTHENVEELCLAVTSLFRWLQSTWGYLYICSSVGWQTLLSTKNELVDQMMWDIVMLVNSKSEFPVELLIWECIARIADISILVWGSFTHVLDTKLHLYRFGQLFIHLSWDQQTKTYTERSEELNWHALHRCVC